MGKNLPMKSPTHEIVMNTGPVIAQVAATDSLGWLSSLYRNIWLPHEVIEELSAGGPLAPEPAQVRAAGDVIQMLPPLPALTAWLTNELDRGEASVIHTAIKKGVGTVAIDEKTGRRVARLQGLKVTGSLGILIRARKEGLIASLDDSILRMRSQGIWLSEELTRQALVEVGER